MHETQDFSYEHGSVSTWERSISTPVITSGSSVSSELVIRVQLTDNGAFYRCEANNSALKKPLSAFVRLSVRFPPANVSITVQPLDPRTGDNFEHMSLILAENSSARSTRMGGNSRIPRSPLFHPRGQQKCSKEKQKCPRTKVQDSLTNIDPGPIRYRD
ncbi:uncharacterized protein TNIN_282741 [Trichonephila inaurata madagascariensis]|uniref:Ig-like domain-containing protein n=1 Tax=Trichonephila inaurata madagascariensis TaxID=2747483 RepID=A0A8X6X782_9ARAC|nr:uncharacterized protein TNIN_282741 [Trichonephila inaurata madagascariensis]